MCSALSFLMSKRGEFLGSNTNSINLGPARPRRGVSELMTLNFLHYSQDGLTSGIMHRVRTRTPPHESLRHANKSTLNQCTDFSIYLKIMKWTLQTQECLAGAVYQNFTSLKGRGLQQCPSDLMQSSERAQARADMAGILPLRSATSRRSWGQSASDLRFWRDHAGSSKCGLAELVTFLLTSVSDLSASVPYKGMRGGVIVMCTDASCAGHHLASPGDNFSY